METYEINYDKETVDNLIQKRIKRGDLEGALITVKRAVLFFDDKTEYYALAAEISESMELYEQSIDYWHKYLTVCTKTERGRGYNGLGADYYYLGDDAVASFYFQEQLSTDRTADYKYNDVLMDFAGDTFNERGEYYLAYPYEKADFSNLTTACRQMITAGKYAEAIEKLSIIPPESKFYSDALSLKAIARFVSGDKVEALKDITASVEADKKNAVAICNAVSMFSSSSDKEGAGKFLRLLEGLPVQDGEELYKITMVYCEVGNHEKAYESAISYLKENEYNVNMLFIKGLILFNLKRFSEAKESFSYLYRLTESPVSEFYRDLSAVAGENYKTGEDVPEIPYTFDLPERERMRRYDLIDSLVKNKARCKKLTTEELLDFASYGKFLNSINMQMKVVKIFENNGGRTAKRILKDYLISVAVYDSVKLSILENFIFQDKISTANCVFGNLYHYLKMPAYPFPKEAEDVFKRSFAVAIARLSMVNCDLEIVKDVAFETYCVIKSSNIDCTSLDANALAAITFRYTGIKKLNTKKELASFFDTTVAKINKIEKMIKESVNDDD